MAVSVSPPIPCPPLFAPPIGGRFLFANHDGVAVELSVLPSTRVVDVKHRLREVWPPALLNAERKNISGSNTTSNMRTPNGILSHNHHDSNSDYQEEYWPESEDEDGVYEDEGEDDDDGTVASCSGAGLSASRWRAPEVDRLRLICMGQGLLKDSRTLQGNDIGGGPKGDGEGKEGGCMDLDTRKDYRWYVGRFSLSLSRDGFQQTYLLTPARWFVHPCHNYAELSFDYLKPLPSDLHQNIQSATFPLLSPTRRLSMSPFALRHHGRRGKGRRACRKRRKKRCFTMRRGGVSAWGRWSRGAACHASSCKRREGRLGGM